MKTRFHVDRCLEMRTNSKMRIDYADIRLLDQKITFHMSRTFSNVSNARATNDFRHLAAQHPFSNIQKTSGAATLMRISDQLTSPKIHRAPLSQRIAHDSLCNAPLTYSHTIDRGSRQVGALTIAPSPCTTDPSTCFTFHKGSL